MGFVIRKRKILKDIQVCRDALFVFGGGPLRKVHLGLQFLTMKCVLLAKSHTHLYSQQFWAHFLVSNARVWSVFTQQGMLLRFARKNNATFLKKRLLEAWHENRAGDAFQGANLGVIVHCTSKISQSNPCERCAIWKSRCKMGDVLSV